MGHPVQDSEGRLHLIEVLGNLYDTQEAGRVFWQFMRCFLLEIGFVQSDVEQSIFYLFWDEPFTCPHTTTPYAASSHGFGN
jgi:hypothetical protein